MKLTGYRQVVVGCKLGETLTTRRPNLWTSCRQLCHPVFYQGHPEGKKNKTEKHEKNKVQEKSKNGKKKFVCENGGPIKDNLRTQTLKYRQI